LLKRAVRIEFEGDDGEKYTIKLEGRLSKDKVMRIMDMYELLSGNDQPRQEPEEDTCYGRIKHLVANRFTLRRFTSDQLRETYEDVYNEPVKIATISTYLTRMVEQGSLSRSRRGRKWTYSHITTSTPERSLPHLSYADLR